MYSGCGDSFSRALDCGVKPILPRSLQYTVTLLATKAASAFGISAQSAKTFAAVLASPDHFSYEDAKELLLNFIDHAVP